MFQELFADAVRRHQANRLDEAERLYGQVLANDPGHVDALHMLGVVAAQSGRHAQAAELIGKAVALSPDFALAHYNLGNALRALGRDLEAAAAFQRAVALNPRHAASHNNLGAALRALGRCDEAVAAYRRALELRPQFPEAHYNMGATLHDLGRHQEAEAAYRRAIAQKPDHVDAFVNLGAVLQACGRPADALASYRRALAIRSEHVDALVGVGIAEQALGHDADALAAFERALALRPQDPAPHLRYGLVLQALGRHDEAVGAYRRALALDPDHAEAHIGLAVAMQEAGRPADALAAVDRALVRDPASAHAWFVRSDLKSFTPDDPEIEQMESLLASADARGTDGESRLNLEFAVAKAWMDAGEPAKAFARLDAANARKRAGLTYDVNADVRRLAAIGEAFTPELMRRLAGAGDPSDLPVFVVGMPRSGTTLVEQVLATHPQIFGAGELAVLKGVVERAYPVSYLPRLPGLSGAALKTLGRAYVEGVAALAGVSARLVDKMPANFEFAGLIHLMLPNARIIHCRRDPVDTCLSCYSKNFAGRQDFAYDQRELGTYYRAYEALTTRWRDLLPADRFIEVNYEAVVGDLEGQARRLIAFCGLSWDDACLDFHAARRPVRTASANQVRRPIYRTSVARWKAYASHLGPLLSALGVAPDAAGRGG